MKRLLLAVISIALLLCACSGGQDSGVWVDPSKISESPSSEVTSDDTQMPAETPADTSAQTPAPEPVSAKLIAAGDLMCLYGQLNAAKKGNGYDFDYCFDQIREYVSSADLSIANLETLVADGYEYTGAQRGNPNPKMNAPDSYLNAVVDSGFDVLVNANNHICDRGSDGIDKTIKKMDEAGVKHTGVYETGGQRDTLIVDVKGINVAILGYLDHLNGYPGVYEPEQINMYTEELAAADIAAAKDAGADFILVYMHWGTENTTELTDAQKQQAKFLADTGADIIIGSHPHCPQSADSIETDHGDVPVFYSLGNIVSSMARDINKDSVFVNITLSKDPASGKTTIADLSYTPAYCGNTKAGNFAMMLADLKTVMKKSSRELEASRERIIKAVGEEVARAE